MKRKLISLIGLAIVGIALVAQPVMAHEGHDHGTVLAAERLKGRLDEARKKVCENRKVNIGKIITNAANHGQRHLNLFGNIATKVQQFYVDKKLTVADYDVAVQKIIAQKTALQNAINDVKASANSLDCSSNDPIGTIDTVKAKITAMHKAQRELQTAVKNLIVLTRTALGGSQ